MQGSIKFIGIVGYVFLKVENSTIELTHVLNNWLWHEAPFDKIL